MFLKDLNQSKQSSSVFLVFCIPYSPDTLWSLILKLSEKFAATVLLMPRRRTLTGRTERQRHREGYLRRKKTVNRPCDGNNVPQEKEETVETRQEYFWDSSEELEPLFAVFVEPEKHEDLRIEEEKDPLAPCFESSSITTIKQENGSYSSGGDLNPLECTVCKMTFTQKENLLSHMLVHTINKPFKCTVCAKCFIRKRSLLEHVRIHTGEKPFQCTVCGKWFRLKALLDVHMRVHTGAKPFQCTICMKSFSQKSTLNIHSRIHTGERPFKCTICEKGFTTKQGLQMHAPTHSRETHFLCTYCGKSFSKQKILITHLRIHT